MQTRQELDGFMIDDVRCMIYDFLPLIYKRYGVS